jgi:hypothetical protein
VLHFSAAETVEREFMVQLSRASRLLDAGRGFASAKATKLRMEKAVTMTEVKISKLKTGMDIDAEKLAGC